MTSAFPAQLQPAADQDLPPPRRSTRWAAWRRRSRSATTPPRTKRRWRRCAPTSSARPATAMTAPGSPIPGLVAIAKEIFDREMPQPNQIARKRQDVHVTATGSSRGPRRHDHRGRAQAEPQCRDRLYRGVAARHRLRAALQSDGGRRDRRDQPRPGLAMDPPRRQARRRPHHRRGAVPQAARRGACEAARVKPRRAVTRKRPSSSRADRGAGLPRIPDPAGLRHDHGGGT